ncbi:MBL fold metallo-hydrolase [Streptomyces gilvus]|uniref:MBL fold metallo-hydrolase n=1 Tax=Streptomyces gilvus TaxID=2920937 RepID=UPI001F112803|nr:MBL fold metallo-hydrolase [Streptomyces sp. CME 23]MCH5673229.1 MBL fold metallo-hydrolase [Streptomyces sp. CME 23]
MIGMNLPDGLAPVADGLHLWAPAHTGTWGFANCLLITSGEEAALVDTPYDRVMTEALVAAAGSLLPAGGVRIIVNTHGNGDHTFGNGCFPGAEIIATKAGAEHLCHEPSPQQMHFLTHQTPADQPLGWYARRHFGRYRYEGVEAVPPTLTFSGRHELAVGDIQVELIEVGPAHSAGDLVVHFPGRGVVCAGDVLFAGDHPVHWNGPLANVVAACEAILALEPEVVVPGHGAVMTPRDVQCYVTYLRELEALIHSRHAAGFSADEAAADILGSGFHDQLGLPERIVILTAVEYRHLDGDTGEPDLVALAARAADWAYRNRGDD